jgi:carbonic anhydrase
MLAFLAFLALAHGDGCSNSKYQSPVDIMPPFTYVPQEIDFYLGYQEKAILYHNNYTLRIDGDFGGFKHENSWFWSTEIYFRSPSEHALGGKRLPLEMQVYFHDQDDNLAVISAFFKNSTIDSEFLNNIGFGNPQLRDAEVGTLFSIEDPVDLDDFLGEPKNFLKYEGSTTFSPCRANVTWIILSNTYKVSQRQLDNFPTLIKNKHRDLQPLNERTIYSSFRSQEEPSSNSTSSSTSSNQTMTETLSHGQTYKQVNDDFIYEDESYDESFPKVKNVYTGV